MFDWSTGRKIYTDFGKKNRELKNGTGAGQYRRLYMYLREGLGEPKVEIGEAFRQQNGNAVATIVMLVQRIGNSLAENAECGTFLTDVVVWTKELITGEFKKTMQVVEQAALRRQEAWPVLCTAMRADPSTVQGCPISVEFMAHVQNTVAIASLSNLAICVASASYKSAMEGGIAEADFLGNGFHAPVDSQMRVDMVLGLMSAAFHAFVDATAVGDFLQGFQSVVAAVFESHCCHACRHVDVGGVHQRGRGPAEIQAADDDRGRG